MKPCLPRCKRDSRSIFPLLVESRSCKRTIPPFPCRKGKLRYYWLSPSAKLLPRSVALWAVKLGNNVTFLPIPASNPPSLCPYKNHGLAPDAGRVNLAKGFCQWRRYRWWRCCSGSNRGRGAVVVVATITLPVRRRASSGLVFVLLLG